jgi:hypothetical protein
MNNNIPSASVDTENITLRTEVQFLSKELIKAYRIIHMLNRKNKQLTKQLPRKLSPSKRRSLVAIFILLSAMSFAQDILKKANTVIITDTITQQMYYSKITTLLFENGYGILSTDKEQGTITTTERSFKDGSIKLNILIKDNRVIMRGDFKASLTVSVGGVSSTASWLPVMNYGAKKSAYQNAWNELLKISDQIPGVKEYQIR